MTPELRYFIDFLKHPPRVRMSLLTVCEVGAVMACGAFWTGLGWCAMSWWYG